jgi:hypothetical protein
LLEEEKILSVPEFKTTQVQDIFPFTEWSIVHYLAKPITFHAITRELQSKYEKVINQTQRKNSCKMSAGEEPGHGEVQAETHPQTHRLFLVQHPAIAPDLSACE